MTAAAKKAEVKPAEKPVAKKAAAKPVEAAEKKWVTTQDGVKLGFTE